jgi:SecD/SecF fusion protein
MFRAPFWRAVTACAVIVISLIVTLAAAPRLGLDLRGGTQLVFETKSSATVQADAAATDRALNVLRQRADALGVVDPTLVRSGERRIIVELPGVLDPRQAAEVIGRTAQLAFHPVLGAAEPGDKEAVRDENGGLLKLGPAAITGDGVSDAAEQSDPQRRRPGASSPGTRPAGRRTTPGAASPSCWTRRSSPRRRSTPPSRAAPGFPAAAPRSPAPSPTRRRATWPC